MQNEKPASLLERLNRVTPGNHPGVRPVPSSPPRPQPVIPPSVISSPWRKAAHTASSALTGLAVSGLVIFQITEDQRRNMRIPLKPEAENAIELLTASYMRRGTTRWACKYAKSALATQLPEKYHPAIDVSCKLLRDLPRLESQKFLATIHTAKSDGVVDAKEIAAMQTILAANHVHVSCPDLETALAPLDESKTSVVIGKKIARAVTSCPSL